MKPMRLGAIVTFAAAALVAAASCTRAGGEKPASHAGPAGAGKTISGRASVIDGDGLEIGGEKIRLFGIDAPEIDQYCRRSDGTRWRCGHYASVELDRLVAGREVECAVRDVDRYGRPVAVCKVAGADLAEAQTRAGWALAYRKFTRDYVDEEDAARAARRGVWQGEFDAPWSYRQRMRAPGK